MTAVWTEAAEVVLGEVERGPVVSPNESFDEFVRREQAGLVRFAGLLCGSQAQGEDLVQDVLIKVYRRWDSLQDHPATALAYVRRAVSNEHISWRRRWHTRHVQPVPPEELPDSLVEGPKVVDDRMWRTLLTLPAQQRAAVVLRYYEDLTDAEIGDVLGCREGTVRSHISRALTALRALESRDAQRGSA